MREVRVRERDPAQHPGHLRALAVCCGSQVQGRKSGTPGYMAHSVGFPQSERDVMVRRKTSGL